MGYVKPVNYVHKFRVSVSESQLHATTLVHCGSILVYCGSIAVWLHIATVDTLHLLGNGK